ncbi:MAG TPA: hypothetical protein VII30_09915 [Gemmatimonadaceae bacterium]
MTVKRGALAQMMLKTLEVLVPLHGYGITRRIATEPIGWRRCATCWKGSASATASTTRHAASQVHAWRGVVINGPARS